MDCGAFPLWDSPGVSGRHASGSSAELHFSPWNMG